MCLYSCLCVFGDRISTCGYIIMVWRRNLKITHPVVFVNSCKQISILGALACVVDSVMDIACGHAIL